MKIRLKMVFAKDDLAVIVSCFTEKRWTGTRIAKEFPKKTVIENLAEVERLCQSQNIHC